MTFNCTDNRPSRYTIYTPQKFCTTYIILVFFEFKTLRVYNFAKSEEKCTKQYRNLVLVCGNKYMNF